MSVNIMAQWINLGGRFKWSFRRQLTYIRFTNSQVISSSKGTAYHGKRIQKKVQMNHGSMYFGAEKELQGSYKRYTETSSFYRGNATCPRPQP